MNGKYRIYDNGELIAEIPNVITTDGKKIITRFLAKNNNAWAGAMCVGSGRTSPVVGDKTLNFEYARFPVYYSYGFFDTTYKIIFKAMMPENFAGAIEEIGMYSQMTNLNSTTYDSPFNLFDNVNDWTATGVTVTEQPSIATITSSATATRIKTGTAGYSVAGTGNLYRDFSHVNFSEYARVGCHNGHQV
jgi:ribosomal protein S16